MLYLRNTNQQQTIAGTIGGVQRGSANLCCFPTLDSVVTASFTQLTLNTTLGNYFFNCKSCVGLYAQVSENSGSTWTTIDLGSCSSTNLVPQPSESAYYRVFTSCSVSDQPGEALTSSFSNEVFFIPSGYINYKFTENGVGANGIFSLYQDSTILINASSSVSGTFWTVPSASVATASLFATEFPLTGSTSMSLIVTGSGESFSTSSCLQSGSIFLDSWKVVPHLFYDVTASISHRPENSCGDLEDLGYIVNSYDETTGIWYHANQYGVPDTSGTYPSASVTGSAVKTNILSGDCRYNAIQFSGSLTLPVNPGNSSFPFRKVYMAIVTGSFTLSGNDGSYGWNLTVRYENTGSIEVPNYILHDATTKNACVGLQNNSFVGPGGDREMSLFVSGSNIATNPPYWSGGTNLGSYITLTGNGIIRAFGYGYFGSSEGLGDQSQYNCIYETTPSK